MNRSISCGARHCLAVALIPVLSLATPGPAAAGSHDGRPTARVALNHTSADLCKALEGAPRAAGLGSPRSSGGDGRPNVGLADGRIVSAHSMECQLQDRQQPLRTLALMLTVAADATTMAAMQRDAGFAPDAQRPVERLALKGGECTVSTAPIADPARPQAQVMRWEAVCTAVQGLREMQLLYSHRERSALPPLTEVRTFFEALRARF